MSFEQPKLQQTNKEALISQIKDPDFINALEIAEKKTRLGSGQSAVVWKMLATVNGLPFEFARKQFQSGQINQIEREKNILNKVISIDGVPALLRVAETFLDVELIRGISLGKMTPGERRLIPRSTILNFFKTIIEISAHGIINSDLNVNNIIYDPVSQKLTLVDIGGAVVCEDSPKREQLKFILIGLKKLFPLIKEFDNFYQLVSNRYTELKS